MNNNNVFNAVHIPQAITLSQLPDQEIRQQPISPRSYYAGTRNFSQNYQPPFSFTPPFPLVFPQSNPINSFSHSLTSSFQRPKVVPTVEQTEMLTKSSTHDIPPSSSKENIKKRMRIENIINDIDPQVATTTKKPRQKLTPEQVGKIMELHRASVPLKVIANEFPGHTANAIYQRIYNEKKKSLTQGLPSGVETDEVETQQQVEKRAKRIKLTPQQIKQIVELHESGIPRAEIIKKFKGQTVNSISCMISRYYRNILGLTSEEIKSKKWESKTKRFVEWCID